MSYSKAITEEDLRNILNEVLPIVPHACTPFNSMHYSNSTAVANSNISDTGTWHYPNNFTGYNITHSDMAYGYGYWREDPNGFRILKKGIYRLTVVTHQNDVSGACSHAVRFYNYTDATQLGVVQYGTNTAGYASVQNHFVGLIDAEKTIVPQVQRYSTGNSGSKWKLSDLWYFIELVQDLEAYDPTA